MNRVRVLCGVIGGLFWVTGCTVDNPPTGTQRAAQLACTCDGTGPGGTPLTANCGDTACGSDENTYMCNSPGGSDWSFVATGCGADLAGVCTCTGAGPGGTPVTVNCGQTACGEDNNTWACSASGWSYAANGCSAPADLAGTCSCTGTGPGGTPVTVNCGQSACGEDNNTWACSSDGWSYASDGCSGGGSPDMATAPGDMATGACSCQGTGPGGTPVTANCGNTACGSDNNTWMCNSPGGADWSYFADGCCVPSCAGVCGGSDSCGGTCPDNCVEPATCGGGGTPNVCGNCSCTGTGPDGNPVTANCGDTACGMDNNSWLCNSPGGNNWSYAGNGCSSGPVDLGGCSCTGTGPGGAPVTVSCGQSACGSDLNTWSCSASGWMMTATGCGT